MELQPYKVDIGERYGTFTVLRKRDHRYSVGCGCGARTLVTARKLRMGLAKCRRGCVSQVSS